MQGLRNGHFAEVSESIASKKENTPRKGKLQTHNNRRQMSQQIFKNLNYGTYVLLNVIQATIVGYKSSNLLPILDQLDTSTFSDSRVRLLSFDATAESNQTIS